MAPMGASYSCSGYRAQQPIYGTDRPGHDYLSALEAATPTIEAIAITDYYVTETYERVL